MDAEKFRFRVFLIVLLSVMALGTLGFMVIEGLSLADAIYFSVVTIATVGYGDIHPATQTGKVLAIVLIITGVGTFLGVVAYATDMLLNKRAKQARIQKLNMVVGLFFSEIGTKLLAYFSESDPNVDILRKELLVRANWSGNDFLTISKHMQKYNYSVDIKKIDLEDLRSFLDVKGNLMLRLLENPNLLEHGTFSELLRAVFHLREELMNRDDMSRLPDTDYAHLAGDIKRAYGLLSRQWLDYMKHLKDNYPYLFSLAMRTNPFDKDASPIVK
jgi:voltage-gated potassium channel